MSQIKGYLLVAISAVGFATLGIFAKYAYSYGVNVPTLLTWRFSLSAVMLWVWVLFTKQHLPGWRDIFWLSVMGGIGYNAMASLFLSANMYAPAGLASAVLYTYPVLVTVELALLGWEQLTRLRLLALTTSALGCGLVALAQPQTVGSATYTGLLLALSAAIVYSFYISLGSQVVQRVHAGVATTLVCTAAALVQSVNSLCSHTLLMVPTDAWWTIAGQVLCATVIAILAFFAGVRLIGAGRAAIVSTLEPVCAAILGFILLGERLNPWQLGGGLLVVGSVVLLQCEATWQRPSPPKQTREELA